ncbi:YceI family protein [Micromonospora sp. NPDC048930]|uniref:YceI family protein n=1 Tax=Micromonospora sp. NPDC048930 TaxID=3364261 RepID=UPI0037149B64
MTRLGELTGDYILRTDSRIGFVARHAMSTKVRGQFDEFEGVAYLDGEDPSKSSVQLIIQAKSIQTRNRQRDKQLRARFLDTTSHPTISFNSTTVRQAEENGFAVAGHLTIRGVTKPVTVNFQLISAENDRWGTFTVGFQGSITISRKDWGVNWNTATWVLISERVRLEFDVTAIRRCGGREPGPRLP